LLAATAVAFATTERQKLERTPFAVLRVDESRSPARPAAAIVLGFRRAHSLTVQIEDARSRVVATLARERRVDPGDVTFRWETPAADGVYRPRITLDDGREFTLVNPIRVDSVPPTATLLSYRPHVLRRGAKPRVLIAYRVSEPAHVLLFSNGRRALKGGAKALQTRVEWFARVNGHRLRRGAYRLRLAAVDLAGNVGPRTHVFVVRVR
jgi:hypothetical protein